MAFLPTQNQDPRLQAPKPPSYGRSIWNEGKAR